MVEETEVESMEPQLLRIGQLATEAGVSVRTIDFYTQLGLIAPTSRSAGNFRLYAPEAIDRIKIIRALESNGVTLTEITTALTEHNNGTSINAALDKLHRDLGHLDELATNATDDLNMLLTLLAIRANGLLTAAIDLLT